MSELKTNVGSVGAGFVNIPKNSPIWSADGNSFNAGPMSPDRWELIIRGTNLLAVNSPVSHPAETTIIPAGFSRTDVWGQPPVGYIRPADVTDTSSESFPYIIFNGGISGNPFNFSIGANNLVNDYAVLFYNQQVVADELFFVNIVWPGGDFGIVAVRYEQNSSLPYQLICPRSGYGRTPREASVYAFNIWSEWINRPIPDTPVSPEFSGQPTNVVGGGTGDFDNTSVYPGLTPLATLENSSFITYGLITVYAPSAAQFMGIRDYIWGKDVWTALGKIIPGGDPTKYIISAHLLPLARSQLSPRTGVFEFGIFSQLDEWKLFPKPASDYVLSQYVDISLGEFTIPEYSGTFSDYSPYAQYSLYLPYIGIRNLGADLITGKTLNLTYRIDISSGAAVAYILHEGNVLFSFEGNVATKIPLGSDSSSLSAVAGAVAIGGVAIAGLTGAIGLGVSAASGVAGVKSAASAAGMDAMLSTIDHPAISAEVGRRAYTGTFEAGMSNLSHSLSPTFPRVNPATTGAGLSLLHKSYQVGDANIGVNLGMVNQQSAYLLRVLPNQSVPSDFRTLRGYMCNVSQPVGNFKGYTVFSEFHLEGIPATVQEQNMISSYLKGGIII